MTFNPIVAEFPTPLKARLVGLQRRIGQLRQQHPDGLLNLVGNTPLVALPQVALGVRLWGKLESHNPSSSIKDRTVLYLIADALEQGALQPGMTLVEASSGNTGIALAMLAAVLQVPVLIYMPDNVSTERRDLMRAYGARVSLTAGELGTDGAIEAARRKGREPGYYWLAQHENEANVLAHYDTTGGEILQQCPNVDAFVGSSGTTGTLVGVSMRLKEHNPNAFVVAVWPKDRIMGLRRPEGKARPAIYREQWIDRVVEITEQEANAATRQLARKTGLLLGPSSGAAWLAATRYAQHLAIDSRIHNIVVSFCDDGARYLSTETFA